MSLWNTLNANTIGVLFRAGTGNVDPWTLRNIHEETAASIQRAGGSTADAVQANAQVDRDLRARDAHPDQATGIRLPSLGVLDAASFAKTAEAVLVIVVVLVGGIVVLKVRSLLK